MIICKICNEIGGNGYCAEHSTDGTAYKMTPKYKKVKGLMPRCEICGYQFGGNGNISFPWWCSCREWIWKLKPKKKGE